MANRLRACRQLARISQDQAGEKLGVSGKTISNYERGKSYPDSRILVAMAELYNVSADQLLGLEPLIIED